MASYLVGIGGTGAKCIEAAVHLSAAGLLPDRRLYTLFVDPDRSNGNLGRAKMTLDSYVDGQKIHLGTSPLFGTPIRRADPAVWSPFSSDTGADVNLSNAVNYNQLRAESEEITGLFDVLYSPDEREADLTVGFRGHPSIGAAVMAQQLTLDEGDPWKTFKQLVANDTGSGQKARVFLCGSVFGGTGAAGLPTIGKLIRQELAGTDDVSFEVSCGLVLPYFSFEGTPQDKGIQARAKSFVPNTQSALKYYWDKRHDDIFDSMYVVGDPGMSTVGDASVGGRTQENDPHFVELIVALAAADFFKTGSGSGQVAIMARESDDKLVWNDLPYPESSQLRRRLSQLIRFAFAYLSTYKPALNAIRDGDRSAYEFPWLVDLVEKQGVSLNDNSDWKQFEAVEMYAERFLLWLAQLHSSARGTDVRLADCSAFARLEGENVTLRDESDFRRERFDRLDRSDQKVSLERLWTHLSSISAPRDPEGTGILIRSLHDACDPEGF